MSGRLAGKVVLVTGTGGVMDAVAPVDLATEAGAALRRGGRTVVGA